MTITIIDAPLTNRAWGYPEPGDSRRVDPIALANLHITANPNTPPATAMSERNYANRDRRFDTTTPDYGPTAGDYVDRDGSRVRALLLPQVGWSNGALRSPKIAVPGVQAVVDFVARGFNPNEAYWRTIEHCGRYSAYPITIAQKESTAEQIALDSMTTGITISRETVHLHSDLDTQQKPNCPVPAAQAEAWVADIIARAQEHWRTLMNLDELLAELARAIADLRKERDDAVTRNTAAVTELEIASVAMARTLAALKGTP